MSEPVEDIQMPKIPIKKIKARQILDSRGQPTIEVVVETSKGVGIFGVPSGVSTGKAEAYELRDGGKEFMGMGVSKAVYNVNEILAKKIRGFDVTAQEKVDEALIHLDGSANKRRLGANALLGVSGAACKAAAQSKKIEVFEYLASLVGNKKPKLPGLMSVVIEGGLHGDTNLDLQEFMLVPKSKTIFGGLRIISEVFFQLNKVLISRGLHTNLGNEGAYSPKVDSNRQALDFIAEAVSATEFTLGKDLNTALDVAASTFYRSTDHDYHLAADKTALSAERLVSLLKEWVSKYSICSIEDGLAEEDWAGWLMMQERLGSEVLLVADDLTATSEGRLKKAIDMKAANAVAIKPNQVGTITETLATAKLAQKNNYKIVVSQRAGETNDDFIADLAVGVSADYLKAGSVARGERVAKYNRLLKIEQELLE